MTTKIQQKQLINYTKMKLKDLFSDSSDKAHDYTHSARVAGYAVQIARSQKASVFMCELAGWLHDIGRTIEKENPGVTHHELSYRMCQQWFREDGAYNVLSDLEKRVLLYALRYHWNNFADASEVAIILRDADKIDMFGKIGILRAVEYCKHSGLLLETDFRGKFDSFYWLRTAKAKAIIKQKKMMAPVEQYYKKLLLKKIKPVAL